MSKSSKKGKKKAAKKAAAEVSLEYQAIQSTDRRQAPRTVAHHEDRVLSSFKRKKLTATAQDQARNYSLLAWMIRRHVDYVSQHKPHVRTGHRALDKKVKRLLDYYGRPEQFDIRGRLSRDEAMRLFEMSKVVGGDAAFLELRDGRRQLFEGTSIGKAKKGLPKKWEPRVRDSGLVLDKRTGAMTHACLLTWNAEGNEQVFGRMVPAKDFIFDAYWPRVSSSRGVSPLSTALNTFADLMEAFELTHLKIKLHTLFGIAVTRDGAEYGEGGEGYDGEEDEDDDLPNAAPAGIDLGNGPALFNMEPGEKVEVIESQTPGSQFIDFSRFAARVGLLSLDIPFTAFDAMQSSFSARIADREEYEYSARSKRLKNQQVLNRMTQRDVERWGTDPDILSDDLKEYGVTVEELAQAIQWIPIGMPWMDKLKEVAGDEKAIAIGIESSPRAALRRGVDAYECLEEQAEFLEYAKELGVPITIGAPGQSTVEEKKRVEGEPNEETNDE